MWYSSGFDSLTHAQTAKERAGARVTSGERRRVGDRGLLRVLGRADFERHDGFAEIARACGQHLETAQIFDPLDM